MNRPRGRFTVDLPIEDHSLTRGQLKAEAEHWAREYMTARRIICQWGAAQIRVIHDQSVVSVAVPTLTPHGEEHNLEIPTR